jgi:hypothetical protein
LAAFFINENPIGFTRDISYTDKEVKKMNELKEWPFDFLDGIINPLGGDEFPGGTPG